MGIQLRDYQQDGADQIRAEFKQHDTVIYVLSTGGGKTYLFCYIADCASAKNRNVMIVVHRKELLLQASRSLRSLGIDHGLISPHFTPSPHKRVQVASIDTLTQRLKNRQYKVDLLIFDEGHHVIKDNKWGRVHDLLGRPKTLLVTATPARGDGVGLGLGEGGIAGAMVLGPPINDLIERGMLVNPIVYTCLDTPDFSGLKKGANGDFNPNDLAERTDRPKITGSAVAHYKEICPGEPAVVFCTNVKHAKNVVAQFNKDGFKFALLVGAPEMSDAERTATNVALARGDLHGVCTVDLVSEGYDLPALVCCIMLRRTESVSLFLQQAGRVMRPAAGKTKSYILDHVANTGIMKNGQFVRKHGLPSDHREWSLERKKKNKKKKDEDDIVLKQCPSCYHVFAPAACCPKCGLALAQPKRELEEVEGNLYQVTPEMAIQQIKQQKIREVAKARTLQELKEIEKQRGYKPGWSQHTFNARKRRNQS